MTIAQFQENVRLFMARINTYAEAAKSEKRQAIGSFPQIRDAELRANLIMEEARETAEALTGHRWIVVPVPTELVNNGPDIVEVADGCGDLLVVTAGCAVACGFELEPVVKVVQESNWTKFREGAYMRDDGKFVKSEAFAEPDVAGELTRQAGKR